MINLIFLWLALVPMYLPTSTETDILRATLDVSGQASAHLLDVSNINGSIQVEGTTGKQIIVEVRRTIKGDSPQAIAQGKEEIQLGTHQVPGFTALYMKTPCSAALPPGTDVAEYQKYTWKRWKDDCSLAQGYDYQLDYTIKVPQATSLEVTTVNRGDLGVRSVRGKITAHNVNGDIAVEDIQNRLNVRTVNGEVDLYYTGVPADGSSYYSLNGDITVWLAGDLNAEVFFESYNGDLYLDSDRIQAMPTQVIKEEEVAGRGIKKSITARQGIQVGRGGPKLGFETFNGDVYLRKQ